jgi:predicted O-methyltransferase YrrM
MGMRHKAKRSVWMLRNLFARFPEAREAKRPEQDWKAIVNFIIHFDYGFLAPMQIPTEVIGMLEAVEKLSPQTVLEIGTAKGGTLFLLSRAAAPDALLISVDLPGGRFGGQLARLPVLRRWMLKRTILARQTVRFVPADSHKKETLETVERLLQGRALDVLFIDADHTYESVKRDFEMYSPLVAPGGLIIFHDIACRLASYGVSRLWEEVKACYRFEEIIDRCEFPLWGFGILYGNASIGPTPRRMPNGFRGRE